MRVLLVKLRHLGDTLLLTPTLRFIKEHFPHAQIDVMVRASCEALLDHNPDVHRVFAIARPEAEQRTFRSSLKENVSLLSGIRRTKYDFAFDLSDSDRAKLWIWLSRAQIRGFRRAGLRRSWKHKVFNRFDDLPLSSEHQVVKDFETVTRIMGIQGQPGPLQFHPKVDLPSLAERFSWLDSPKPFAVLHATSRWSFKEWIPQRWAEVIDSVSALGFNMVLSGGPDPRERETVSRIQSLARVPTVSIAGAVSLHEFGHILGRAKLFLGVDTFAMHLAAAMQTPTVPLFGPSQLTAWTPWQNRAAVPPTLCQCDGSQYRSCANPVSKCLNHLTVASVLECVSQLGVNPQLTFPDIKGGSQP
jgi:heptosyltransferase-3